MSWYPPTVTVAPVSEPLTLEQAKAQCRIDTGLEDGYITGLIASARAYVEAYCGTPLATRTVAVLCDAFADFAVFPLVPLSSVSSITYLDENGDGQTLGTDVYEVRSSGLQASIVLKYGQSWPAVQTGSRITVTAVVGRSSALDDDVLHAMKLLISQWVGNRSAASERELTEMPHAVAALLSNHRNFAF